MKVVAHCSEGAMRFLEIVDAEREATRIRAFDRRDCFFLRRREALTSINHIAQRPRPQCFQSGVERQCHVNLVIELQKPHDHTASTNELGPCLIVKPSRASHSLPLYTLTPVTDSHGVPCIDDA